MPSEQPYQVTSSKMAEVLFQQQQRDVLSAFVCEQTLKEAAEILDLSLSQLYPRVQRLEKLGLLHVTKTEARAGRAVKYYRVVAEEFFIANDVVSLESLHEKLDASRSQQLWRSIYAASFPATSDHPDWGMRIFYHSQGGFVMQATWSDKQDWDILDEQHVVMLPFWYHAKLSRERARAMQRELHDVFFKYINTQDEEGETYILRVAMAPLAK
jgi:predicted transcriptional regulator